MSQYTVTVTLTATIEAESADDASECLWDLLSSDYAFDSDQVLEVSCGQIDATEAK